MPGYELKLNSYDLGVDIELLRRRPAAAVRAPRGARGRAHQRQGQDLLRRREHPDAGRVAAPVEGELLQVHQRDPQRHRGRDRALRPDLPRRAERHRVRRRLRAGAGLRAHPAHRRPLVGRVAARAAAARRAARHRRADPGDRQAARAPRPGRLLRHPVRGRRRQEGRRSGGWSTRWCRAAQWDETVADRAAELAARSARPPTRPGIALPAAGQAARPTTAIAYRHVPRRSTGAAGCVEITVRGPAGEPPPTRTRARQGARSGRSR